MNSRPNTQKRTLDSEHSGSDSVPSEPENFRRHELLQREVDIRPMKVILRLQR